MIIIKHILYKDIHIFIYIYLYIYIFIYLYIYIFIYLYIYIFIYLYIYIFIYLYIPNYLIIYRYITVSIVTKTTRPWYNVKDPIEIDVVYTGLVNINISI